MEMSKKKTLYDISWQVSEEIYRSDPALHQSALAKFDKEGFNKLSTLFDRIESPSLTFGSAVDSILTGGEEEFNSRFFVADIPNISDSVMKMVMELFVRYSDQYCSLNSIPTSDIVTVSEELKYQLNWKPETRAKVIKEQGDAYYSMLFLAKSKTILNVETYTQVKDTVEALRTSPATAAYFAPNTDDLRIDYQLKFKDTLGGIEYKCMADILVTDYVNKKVYPVDLKTSSHTEWDFFQSFIDWRYSIQARLYWRLIRQAMDKDDFFKSFTLEDYVFIVANKKTLTPMSWIFEDTQKRGTLYYGKNKQLEMRDPEDLGKQLYSYLTLRPPVPDGFNLCGTNSLTKWINTL